jgi:uncharacterized protein YerC
VDKVLTLREWHKLDKPSEQVVIEEPKKVLPRLTTTQREEVKARLKNGERLKSLAIDYNVTTTTIWRIKRRLNHELEL